VTVFYVTGNVKGSGKTYLASALAQHSLQSGVSTALVKPVSVVDVSESGKGAEKDLTFYSQLDQGISRSQNDPMVVSINELLENPQVVETTVADVLESANQSTNVIVEGIDWFLPDGQVNPTAIAISGALRPKIVLVLGYRTGSDLSAIAGDVEQIGDDLLGVLINGVTQHRWHYVLSSIVPAFTSSGVEVLGVIPEDRRMLAPSVNDIAAHLNAEILSSQDNCDELVEHFMVGGWFLDKGTYVFDRRKCKAVVVRADRPDLQMAALQSSAMCLILTGGQNPIQYITYHADQLEIPLLSVSGNTIEIMEKLETLSQQGVTYNSRKTERFGELIDEFVSPRAFESILGTH
jgi:BioD-like phosphotransacetylase family protein